MSSVTWCWRSLRAAKTIIDPGSSWQCEKNEPFSPARRACGLGIRAELPTDELFLIDLFIACWPLPTIGKFQASAQLAGHRQQHPDAMRRIILHEGKPIARNAVDWNGPGGSHGVDIAVLPGARHSQAGPAMLKAWLEVADLLGRPCSLDVLAANRARLLYRRLGFVMAGEHDSDAPVQFMTRPAPA